MIIDANAHPTPDGSWFGTHYNAGVSHLLGSMDSAGVEKAIIIPLGGIMTNDFSIQLANTHPDRFIPGISFNPGNYETPELAAAAFVRETRDISAPIMKLHSRLGNYDLTDPRVEAVLQANEEREKPFVVFICGLLYSNKLPVAVPPPHLFQKLAIQFSGTTFVIMHAACAWAMQVFDAIRGCRNTYMDLSYVQTKYQGSSIATDLGYLCRNFDQRLIWGTDFPEIEPGAALAHFESLAPDLPDDKKRNILSNNITKILYGNT